MIKVFVGTMYTIENELLQCVKSIHEQTEVSIEHVILSNLPEREAHNELWKNWHQRRDQGFDMFVKVDADTIIKSPDVFKVAHKTMIDFNATGIQAPLYDYISGIEINGLNFFMPAVSFKESTSELYCDRADIGNDNTLRGSKLPNQLKPAGYHCKNPSNIQAFHYGLHRMLKGQHATLNSVKNMFRTTKLESSKWALFGTQYASQYPGHIGFNYSDEKFQQHFDHALKNEESNTKLLLSRI